MDRETLRQDSVEILKQLGHADQDNDPYSRKGPKTYCEYNFQGLNIISENLPYNDNPWDSVPYISHPHIFFDGKLVFDSDGRYYIPGVWEEILHELRNKIPAILRQREEQSRINKMGSEFLDKYVKYITKNTVINEDIKVVNREFFLYEYPYGKECYERLVLYKGKEVFCALRSEDEKELGLAFYYPGEWEKPVAELGAKLKQEQEERRRNHVDKRLVYLRNLK